MAKEIIIPPLSDGKFKLPDPPPIKTTSGTVTYIYRECEWCGTFGACQVERGTSLCTSCRTLDNTDIYE